MATNYPTSLDDDTSLFEVTDAVDDVIDDHHNNLKDAIIAVETKVGTGSSTPSANTVLKGTGSGTSEWAQQNASEVAITDSGGYFTGTDVETALQEIGAGTTLDGRYVNTSGDTMTGVLTLSGAPTSSLHAATKRYVDEAVVAATWNFFLTDDSADVGGYYYMYDSESGGALSELTSATLSSGDDQLLWSFITESGKPGIDTLSLGIYTATMFLYKTGTKTVNVYWKIFKRDTGGTETELMTSEVSDDLTDSRTQYILSSAQNSDISIDPTDRIVFKLYANVSGGGSDPTVTLSMEGNYDSRIALRVASSAFSNVFVNKDGDTMTGNLTMNGGNIVMSGAETVDGVDVSEHDHSGAGQGGTIDHNDLSNIGTNTHAQIDSHISATSAHGVSGDIVGTSDTQTLSNKTLTASTLEGNNGVSVVKIKDSGGTARNVAKVNASDVLEIGDSGLSGLQFNKTPKTDTISEKTAGAGVTADGVLLKDGAVYLGTDKIQKIYPYTSAGSRLRLHGDSRIEFSLDDIADTDKRVGIWNTTELAVAYDLSVTGNLSKGSGSFDIPHPDPKKPKGTRLRHSFVESPTAGDNIYRYVVNVVKGKAKIKLPSYFKHLNKNPQAWVSPVNVLGIARAVCSLTEVRIYASKDGKYNVLVIGTRKDPIATKNWEKKGLEYIKKE